MWHILIVSNLKKMILEHREKVNTSKLILRVQHYSDIKTRHGNYKVISETFHMSVAGKKTYIYIINTCICHKHMHAACYKHIHAACYKHVCYIL